MFKNDWTPFLQSEFEKPYMKHLFDFLKAEYETKLIYPQQQDIFKAFELTPYKDVRVVILGQDPYHGPNQAHGLSFSVQDNIAYPPSLRNIFKELVDDLQCEMPQSGNLTSWSKQGVLLLNTTLTVAQGNPMSHTKQGWEMFTDEVLKHLNERQEPIIFILWGNHAKTKMKLIDTNKHYILTSAHPSPLSARRGFFGSKPFSKTNELLKENGTAPITFEL